MTLDLKQFHEAFFAEAIEALDTMEAALLGLTPGKPDPEQVNTIFRVAHSIKGGSATFGFTEIASFTHTLEALLDELRSSRLQVTRNLCDLLLKSVDVIRELLRAARHRSPIDVQRVADLQFDLELAILEKKSAPLATAPAAGTLQDPHCWQIAFRPYPELLLRGNDPLRLLRELRELGVLEVEADTGRIPKLGEMSLDECYLAWNLKLTGTATREAVLQVFDWAEGDCALEVTEAGPKANPAPRPPESAAAVAASAAVPVPVPQSSLPTGSDSSSIRVNTDRIDAIMNTLGEIVITQAMLDQLGTGMQGQLANDIKAALKQLERNVRELQEGVMHIRMLPISSVFSRFPRMVRDLGQRLGKEIELQLSGEQTELDKTVLEKIGDPLTHLVRNCIDHGIEKPEARRAAGKPVAGALHLEAYHRGGNIVVAVRDDGAGLDCERILAKARERGLVSANEVPEEASICDLIFAAGLTTVEGITELSGRGVGMDVVRRNVRDLGGTVEVRTERGKGCCFTIALPLTLAIVDGQSIAVGSETYIVPLTAIVESIQLEPAMVKRIPAQGEVFLFRDEYVPVIRLHQLFDIKPRAHQFRDGLLMIVEGDGRRAALFVDDLLGQQQVVIKSLETSYRRVDGVSGATILGNGAVALILDVRGLIRAASRRLAA